MADDKKMSEAEFQRIILTLFRTYGWTVAHFGNTVKYVRRGNSYKVIPDKNAAGFPDIVATRKGRLIFAELKREDGIVSKSQQTWLDALALTGAEVFVWRPSQLEEINRIINRIST